MAADQPDVPAVLAPDREPLTFAALWRQMQYIAGVTGGPRSITAIIQPDACGLLTTVLGTMLSGAAAPLNPELTDAELTQQLTSLRPSAVVLGSRQTAAVETSARTLGIRILRAERDVLREVWRPDEPQPPRDLPPGTSLLLHTSGTGGEPKLAPLTATNLSASCANQQRAFALTAGDRFLCLAPLFHLHGFGSAAAQLTVGGSVVCPNGFDPRAFPQWLVEFRPTWYTGGPAVHRAVASLVAAGVDLPHTSLRFVRSSSAALESGLQASLERALGVPFIDSYGLTETGTVAATPLPPGRGKPGSAGVSAGAEIAIIQGEIAVRGPNVIEGYLDDAAANRESFRGGWFRTGDLGHLDADGYLFVTGRLKDVINRGGEKVTPAEIDAALLEHPAVADAAAFGVPHARLGEDVEAAVVRRAGVPLTEAELRAYAAGRLAGFKAPRRIHFTTSIPRTSTGKPRRAGLAALFERPGVGASPAPRALSADESRIAAIWSRVLGCGEIGPEDELPMLGGDSLSAAIILAEVQAEFDIAGSLVTFFDRPTVAYLAQLVAQLAAEDGEPVSSAVIYLGGAGSAAPVFCFPATSNPYYLRHLAARMGRRPFFAVLPPRDPTERTVEELAREAVAAIRAARPQGSCILAGHCFGGVVAFEATRQMRAAGGDVPLLMLLDTPTPGYPKILPRWRRYPKAAWSLLRRAGTRALVREGAAHIRALRRVRLPAAPAGNDEAAAIGRSMHGYVPHPLDRPIVQVLASALQPSTRVLEDARLGWRDFARAGFSMIDAPGDHHTFLLPPQVDELARRLEAVLTPMP